MSFHVITHVWGREYIDLFLNVCLPNQLTPGNLAALPPESRYRILTRAMHVEEIAAHPNVKAIPVPVDVVIVEELDRQDGKAVRYDLMVACHRRAVRDALEVKATLIFLSADVVMSDSALAHLVQWHSKGYRAVMVASPRIVKERVRHEVARPLASRELMRLVLPHLHPMTARQVVTAHEFAIDPAGVMWQVGSEGLLCRQVQLHPLMVDPVRPVLPDCTIDDTYIGEAVPSPADVYVVTDSDDLALVELTAAATRGRGARSDRRLDRVCRMALTVADAGPHHRSFWRQTIRLHSGPMDGWGAVEEDAARFVRQANALRWCPPLARFLMAVVGSMRQSAEHGIRDLRRTRKRVLRAMKITQHRARGWVQKKVGTPRKT